MCEIYHGKFLFNIIVTHDNILEDYIISYIPNIFLNFKIHHIWHSVTHITFRSKSSICSKFDWGTSLDLDPNWATMFGSIPRQHPTPPSSLFGGWFDPNHGSLSIGLNLVAHPWGVDPQLGLGAYVLTWVGDQVWGKTYTRAQTELGVGSIPLQAQLNPNRGGRVWILTQTRSTTHGEVSLRQDPNCSPSIEDSSRFNCNI